MSGVVAWSIVRPSGEYVYGGDRATREYRATVSAGFVARCCGVDAHVSIAVADMATADAVFRRLAAAYPIAEVYDCDATIDAMGFNNLPEAVRLALAATAPPICGTGQFVQMEIAAAITERRARLIAMDRAGAGRSKRQPKRASGSQRTRILERDGFRCRRCGSSPDHARLVVDHIIPVALGGASDDANLQTLCEPCNQGKSDREPHAHDLRPAPSG